MSASHFQSFDDVTDPSLGAGRLAALRGILKDRGLDGFVVPRADAYQNEYVSQGEERLAWLTGFTGSAGIAVVLADRAALFIDGRYTVQARTQVDGSVFELVDITVTAPCAWLGDVLSAGCRLGYDPWLQTPAEVERFTAVCEKAEAKLVPVIENPVDVLWTDRPKIAPAPIVDHPLEFAGRSTDDKLTLLRSGLAAAKAGVLLLSDPHAVAWLFNIRGGDVSHTPLPLCRALVPLEDRPTLFVAVSRLTAGARAALEKVAAIEEPDAIASALNMLGSHKARVMLDPSNAPAALVSHLQTSGAEIILGPDPVTALKAIKNEGEIRGMRAAHKRDGVALCRFLAWLDRRASSDSVTEIDAAIALETFRADTGLLKDISFPTISAAGPNAALPHYRVTEATNRVIGQGLFLIDSGAQYQDGTTDVTRTIAVGELSDTMRDHFTRVLKGHIAIATARFPKGTTGAHLDAFARRALWDIGTDFDHGTGHGVGSYLSVHEGPQRISKTAHVALLPGMILSNEPGYYREGHYGIRTENLLLVTEITIPDQERPMLGFETLTLAPFDRRAIALDLLTREEWAWIDAYHARVLQEVAPELDTEARAWLTAACAPL
ncbi:aminopeptidase P family protein [Agaricicola taiwanensis]|nr:aminopeptidase P family protein [Agaricicola taiwanensis]